MAILEAHGFVVVRQNGTSHRVYRREAAGKVSMTVVAGHPSDDVAIGTLQSIIRQSGLPKSLFKR